MKSMLIISILLLTGCLSETLTASDYAKAKDYCETKGSEVSKVEVTDIAFWVYCRDREIPVERMNKE